MPEFIYSSIFGELTKNVQIRFDKVSELNKKLFDNVIFEQFLDWDIPTIGLDFEELIGQYNRNPEGDHPDPCNHPAYDYQGLSQGIADPRL